MPIEDERRRFQEAKAIAQADVTGEEVHESLHELQEALLLQRRERAEFLAEEENRIEARKEIAKRAREERSEKYERLQQAFKRMGGWKGEEETAAEREGMKGVQGMKFIYNMVQCD